jgi:hypothetical protein
MPIPLAGTITLAAAGVAAAALVVALVVPAPAPPGGTWLDYPTAGASVSVGLTQFTAHASAPKPGTPVTAFRFELSDAAGTAFPVENDQDPSVNGKAGGLPPRTLYVGRVLWQATPGSYTLVEGYLAGGNWTFAPAVAFTVPGKATKPTPTATPTDTPMPTTTSTPTPTPSQSTTPAPPAPPPPAAPTGQVRLLSQSHTGATTGIVAQAYDVTPLNAAVDIQVQIGAAGAAYNPNGTWASASCSNLTSDPTGPIGTYQCTTSYNANNPFNRSNATGWLRVVVTVGAQVTTNYGPSFGINAPIH